MLSRIRTFLYYLQSRTREKYSLYLFVYHVFHFSLFTLDPSWCVWMPCMRKRSRCTEKGHSILLSRYVRAAPWLHVIVRKRKEIKVSDDATDLGRISEKTCSLAHTRRHDWTRSNLKPYRCVIVHGQLRQRARDGNDDRTLTPQHDMHQHLPGGYVVLVPRWIVGGERHVAALSKLLASQRKYRAWPCIASSLLASNWPWLSHCQPARRTCRAPQSRRDLSWGI